MNRTFPLKVLASTFLGLPLAFAQWGPASNDNGGDQRPYQNESRDQYQDQPSRYTGQDQNEQYQNNSGERRDDYSQDYGSNPRDYDSHRHSQRGSLWFSQSFPSGAQTFHKGSAGGSGLWEMGFSNASQPLRVSSGDDELFCWVRLNSSDRPREIMVAWNDGSSWEHRAYWGDNLLTYGHNNSPGRMNAGQLPDRSGWVKLAVPASSVGLAAGTDITGLSVSVEGGQVQFGAVGEEPQGARSFGPLGRQHRDRAYNSENQSDTRRDYDQGQGQEDYDSDR